MTFDRRALREAGRELVVLDRAIYTAVHATPSPVIDHAVARISRAADRSGLWLALAAGMSLLGERPRRAAVVGVTSLGFTSAVVNLAVKPLVRRERPSRLETVRTHVVRMPTSASYPSGHTASAFAFSTAVGGGVPELDTALRLAATVVGYSRVHTGVHYPGDVIAGAVIGAGVGTLARHLARRIGFVPH
ncbi:MAG TPA: phosphatase PAP2 family protein [Nocardioidaceae bacterium]